MFENPHIILNVIDEVSNMGLCKKKILRKLKIEFTIPGAVYITKEIRNRSKVLEI